MGAMAGEAPLDKTEETGETRNHEGEKKKKSRAPPPSPYPVLWNLFKLMREALLISNGVGQVDIVQLPAAGNTFLS